MAAPRPAAAKAALGPDDSGTPLPSEAMIRAAELTRKGGAAYEAGDYQAAVKLFGQAYDLSHVTGLLFNMAQCYRQLDNSVQARAHYQQYLDLTPDAPNRADVKERIAELDRPRIVTPANEPRATHALVTPVFGDGMNVHATAPRDDLDGLGARRRSVLGAVVRVDIDTGLHGAAVAVGASVAVAPAVEIDGALLVGGSPGAEVGLTYLFGAHAVRPFFALSAPIFFEDGVHVGSGLAGGARFGIGEHAAVRLQLGVVHFWSAPRGFDTTVLVPSLGIEGWL